MENENDFRIRTYTKRELACLYCPNTTARCAIRTLTRWIKRNSELYAELLLTGYHARVYAPLLFLMAFICIFPALFVPLPLSIKKKNQ